MAKKIDPKEKLINKIRESEPDYQPESISNVVNLNNIDISDLKTLNFDQLIKTPPEPLVYVSYPILPTQGICFLYAATGLGKTLFALNLSYSIAQGGSFLKYKSPQPRKILYIDGEMSYYDLHTRLMTIAKTHGDLYFKENFSILTPDKIAPAKIPKIDDVEGQKKYIELITKENHEVIIFDNISMLTSIDENSAEEWSIVQDFLLQLRSMGRTCIVIHHAGKNKDGYRGTSRMLDCANTAISLQHIEIENPEQEVSLVKKFKVVYHKHRSFGGHDAQEYEVILDRDIWSYRATKETDKESIIAMVDADMTQREIAKELNLSQTKVNRMIKELRLQGRIRS